MSTVEHTQGPWQVESATSDYPHDIAVANPPDGAGTPVLLGHFCCDEDGGEPDWSTDPTQNPAWISAREANANARLCAAAPELLAACREFVEISGGSKYWHGDTHRVLLLMEAAIQKATVG